MHYKINSPHIVHDTFDGETILVNLKNGNYYSFDKLGVVIWELIEMNAGLEKISGIFSQKFLDAAKKAETDVQAFIQNLLDEKLIVEDSGSATMDLTDEQISEKMKEFASYESPVMNKYTDMQDMLLLDPIHDTDEKGWPSGKDE